MIGVIALALGLSASDGSGRRGERADRAALSARDVDRIARRVERLRGLRFRRPVKPLFVDAEEGARILRGQTEARYPLHRQRTDEEELKLLGLLKTSDDLGKALRATEEEQILGFYDDRSRRLVVVRTPGDSRALAEITLAHELVHALEDQHFDLKEPSGLNDDEAVGETALAEGTATVVMTEYAERYLDVAAALDLSLGATSRTETKLPKLIEDFLLFPYVEGLRFVTTFRPSSGSWRAIDRIIALRPPRSAEQVLHPRRYANDERRRPVSLPSLRGVLGRGWRVLDRTSVGEFDLRELFAIVGGRADPLAAEGWGGGRFALWHRGPFPSGECASPCIRNDVGVLRLRWDAVRDRAEGERALARAVEHGLEGRPLASRSGLWSSRGGAVGVLGSGRGTTVVFAPSASLGARVLLRLAR